MQAEIDLLKTLDKKYNEKLYLESAEVTPAADPDQTQDPQPTTSTRKSSRLSRKQKEATQKEGGSLLGWIPPPMKSQDYWAPDLPFGFKTCSQYSRIHSYLAKNANLFLKPVPADGSCMFNSIIQQIDCEQEYTQVHLRRDMVLFIIENLDYFFNLLEIMIKSQYGEENQEGIPGPFSFVEWLEHMLKSDSYGDEACLHVFSRMFQVPLVVINSDSLCSIRYRNKLELDKQELCLIYVDGNHYMPAG